MAKRIAIIKNGVVENVAVWDGKSPWTPQAFDKLVDVTSLSHIGVGWSHDGNQFTTPPAPKPFVPDVEEKLKLLEAQVSTIEAKVEVISPKGEIPADPTPIKA